MGKNTLRIAILNAILLMGGTIVCPEMAHAQSQAQAYRIEAGDLESALSKFGTESRIQLIYSPELLKNKRSNGLSGSYAPMDALRRLLEGSGLEAESVNDKTVVIKKAPIPPRVPAAKPEPRTEATEATEEVTELDTIIVTGTHIRGGSPIGSRLVVVDRGELEDSGYARIQDYFETLTQNFSGSASEDSNPLVGDANFTLGQAIDLRGLGASSTLILVNGRRLPAGGTEGSFVDISSISSAAVERIEVLTDGASALYGSDAIGGVVNFILRRDFKGLETSQRIGKAGGSAWEYRASLVGGTNWDGGYALAAYQYDHRDRLMAKDTFYGSRGGDMREFGGSDFRTGSASPGTILDPATFQPAYAIPDGQDGTNLEVADLIPGQNYQDLITGNAVLPEQTRHSAYVTVGHEVANWLELFVEGQASVRDMTRPSGGNPIFVNVPRTNPYWLNPFSATAAVPVMYDIAADLGAPFTYSSETKTYAVTGGFNAWFGGGWEMTGALTYASETNEWRGLNTVNAARRTACLSGLPTSGCPGQPLNVFGDGTGNDPVTIDYIRSTDFRDGDYTLRSASVIANGPLFSLPAGDVRMAIGSDYREESLNAERGSLSMAGDVSPLATAVGNLDRNVTAAFAEFVVPIAARTDRNGQSESLVELSLAGRYEKYSDFGDTFNPKFGIDVKPVDSLRLRASWGTSFRAPRFNEISPVANPSNSQARPGIRDPQSPTGVSTILQLTGALPGIEPETAETWTAGFDFAPRGLFNGLSISATYFNISYEDKIRVGGDSSSTLLREEIWAPIIIRNPTPDQIAEICARPDFNAAGGCPPNIAAIVDLRLRNLGALRTDGVDLDARYRVESSIGDLNFRLAATKIFSYETALSETSPFLGALDTVGNPLALRIRGSLGWRRGGWFANAGVNYADNYDDPARDARIGSWTTVDVGAGYEFPDDLRIHLSATNVFDREAPFVDQAIGFDPANASDLGRGIGLSITKHW